VNDLPAVDYPVIQVQVDYPGASPDTVANNIATPLERQFIQITGLELVTSKSNQGHASLTLQFALDKSIDAAATDVQTAITQATGSLPVDLPAPPTFSKTNPNDQPILYIALTSDSVTSGQFDGAAGTALLRPRGQLEGAQAYGDLIVSSQNRATVYLRDVAQVSDSVQDERINQRFWVRGYPEPSATVVVAVYRQAGANAVEVAKNVRALLPLVSAELPGSVRITPIYDCSRTIVNSVEDVQATLVIAFVLVVGVIFVFLGRARDTLIPAVALPLSLLLTFVAMQVLGYSLDNLSLMALTLAIGFLVDDAIVFLENTVRRMEHGEPVLEATLNSAREISFTILSMTISLAAVFLPLVFMSGLVGRIFREFAITIVVAIFASGLVSLTLTPLMCAWLLKARGPGAKRTWMERVIGGVEQRVLARYSASLWWFLRHRWLSALTWGVCMASTVWLFMLVPKAFLPTGDSSFIWGVMIAREGASPAQMRALQDQADAVLRQDPSVGATFTMTGNGQFLSSNQGLLLAFLTPPEERAPIPQVTGQLMGKLSALPGVFPFLRLFPVLEISTGQQTRTRGSTPSPCPA
jgi:hydrophobic/amphiphilic exporter-1 (mainly G- bacteria), HAE1 family